MVAVANILKTTPWWNYVSWAPEVLKAALSEETPCVGPTMEVPGTRLEPKHFDEAFKVTDEAFGVKYVEAAERPVDPPPRGWIVLNARTFADIRKFGRDVLDFETCARLPRTGATLWGYEFITSNDVAPGFIWIVGKRKDDSWARYGMEMEYKPCRTVDAFVSNKGGSIHMCQSMRVWLKSMVDHVAEHPGCRFERCDNPRQRNLTMVDPETAHEFTLGLTSATDRTSWGIDLPRNFVNLLKTPESRDKLAWVLSVGDHCLEF